MFYFRIVTDLLKSYKNSAELLYASHPGFTILNILHYYDTFATTK